jgi:hypothetical protein
MAVRACSGASRVANRVTGTKFSIAVSWNAGLGSKRY